jgi:orotate phosphoribosyltransferase
MSAQGHVMVGTLLERLFAVQQLGIEAVATIPTAADTIGSAIAFAAGLAGRNTQVLHVRKDRVHGRHGTRAGMKVVLVDDTIITGGKMAEAEAALRKDGFDVVMRFALIDLGDKERKLARERGLDVEALFTYRDFPEPGHIEAARLAAAAAAKDKEKAAALSPDEPPAAPAPRASSRAKKTGR